MDLKRSLLIPLFGLLIFLIWLLFYSEQKLLEKQDLHDLVILEKPQGGDFSVNTMKGSMDLQSLRGNVVLLYFGYISCPELCSSTLSQVSLALQHLTQKERSHVKTLFITLDPQRDSLEEVQQYVQYFHGSFIAAKSIPSSQKQFFKRYAVSYNAVQNQDSYLIKHSAYIYLINPKGQLDHLFARDIKVEEIVKNIRKQLL